MALISEGDDKGFNQTLLEEDETDQLMEMLQRNRGDLLRTAAILQKSGTASKLLQVFVNQALGQPFDMILAVGNRLAEACQNGVIEDGAELDPSQLSSVGLYPVTSFEPKEIARVLEQARQDTVKVKGRLDPQNFGVIDAQSSNVLSLGIINVPQNRRIQANLDLRRL